mmetsp:Transcript_75715/g.219908  ORF Transcript_75715/g.219908 Transcript_75715/m.219908 type:complete len:208 (+) Transcript_75715:1023-1646(+)
MQPHARLPRRSSWRRAAGLRRLGRSVGSPWGGGDAEATPPWIGALPIRSARPDEDASLGAACGDQPGSKRQEAAPHGGEEQRASRCRHHRHSRGRGDCEPAFLCGQARVHRRLSWQRRSDHDAGGFRRPLPRCGRHPRERGAAQVGGVGGVGATLRSGGVPRHLRRGRPHRGRRPADGALPREGRASGRCHGRRPVARRCRDRGGGG